MFARDCPFDALAGVTSVLGGGSLRDGHAGLEDEVKAQTLESAEEAVPSPLRMQAVQVIIPRLAVRGAVAQDAENEQ